MIKKWVQFISILLTRCVTFLNVYTTRCAKTKGLFSCDQAALWLVQSVCPSVLSSVTPLSQCSHHHIVMKFSGIITVDRSDVHAKDQGQRSKVMVSEFKTQFSSFRTITAVWIQVWWWNDAKTGLPWSGKSQGDSSLSQSQGKVKEFCCKSGNFVICYRSQGKIREFHL